MRFELVLHAGSKNEVVIKPWNGRKDVEFYEWFRNESALQGVVRKETGTFIEVLKDQPIYYTRPSVPEGIYDIAVFVSDVDGNKYDCGARLVEDLDLQKGERVEITLLGCCSLVNIDRINESGS